MKLAVIDTETTGVDPAVDKIVEMAGVNYEEDPRCFEGLCDPDRPIPPEAMAVHHITEAMVKGQPTPADVLLEMMKALEWPDILVAHNAAFDRGMLAVVNDSLADPKRWICTWRCAMHVWPEAPGHSNQVLRYWLGLEPRFPPGNEAMGPHRALYDVLCTVELLRKLLETNSIEDLVRLSQTPVILHKCRFGKHRGTEWRLVPQDYLRWIVRQDDMDEDTVHTARHYLGLPPRLL